MLLAPHAQHISEMSSVHALTSILVVQVNHQACGTGPRAVSDSGNTAPNMTRITVGILCIAIGSIPLLATLGILPTGKAPSDPAPPWIGWLFGLVFVCAGILVVIRGFMGNVNEASAALPANAPRLLRLVYDLLSVTIVCLLAMLFTWVAFGPGPRHFSVTDNSFSITTSGAGDTMGRVAFGFGSVLFWCVVAGIIVATVRRWRRPPSA